MRSEIRFVPGHLKFGGARYNAPVSRAVVIFRPPHASRRDNTVQCEIGRCLGIIARYKKAEYRRSYHVKKFDLTFLSQILCVYETLRSFVFSVSPLFPVSRTFI